MWMSVETAERIARGAAEYYPNVRIEFAGHGEPLTNPKHLEIIRVFRQHLPKAQMMMTTAGDTIKTVSGPFHRMQERVEMLFDAGISFILLDTYYPEPNRSRLREEALRLGNGVRVFDYYNDWAPLGWSPYRNNGNKIRRAVLLMDDLLARNKETTIRVMDSVAGCNPLQPGPTEPLKLSCGRPFRDLVFAWNGDALLCCDDWQHKFVIANIATHSIQQIWMHPRLEAARARLLAKNRNFGPCVRCDVGGAIRAGLLPDYASPTEEQMKETEKTR
jgi:hypothetical protein